MGLLDFFSGGGDDPQSQAQMAAAMALLQAGGPSRTPVSLGQALGGAMQSYQQTLQTTKDRQQQQVLRSRLALENASMPLSARRDSLRQLTNQATAELTSGSKFDPWRRALQGDPTKPFLGGRAYFPDVQRFSGDNFEASNIDDPYPTFCRR
ncbi:hypothetical protein [Undibacterium umbellatum]|uniref:Uncharacterized protein n=1 Tax=Undibacterium umbellatum TaxID=2762300 RepID=A0ABR6ZGN0_9BURK|nr:hypothetical protein [Undibacterium umbellatum]MBC3910843.1 hypothetical protein [Undibacterium umbellatum]